MDRRQWVSPLATIRGPRVFYGCSPPSRAYRILRDAYPEDDPDALIAELKRELSGSTYRRMVAWNRNLLETAAGNRLSVRVLALLFGTYKRFVSRFVMRSASSYDHAAVISACFQLPGAPQSEFLLANVKPDNHLYPKFPLLVLLAATQSHDDQWACHVLHTSDVTQAVLSAVVVELYNFSSPSNGHDITLIDSIQEAVHGGMHGVLRELLALNRSAVVVAASEWLDRWESIRLIVLARKRLARAPPVDLTNEAETKPWGRLLALEHRSETEAVEAGDVAPHPILTLPGPVFSTVVAFVLAPACRSIERGDS